MTSNDDTTAFETQAMSTPDVTQASTVGEISYSHYLPDVVKEWMMRAGFDLDNQTILFAGIVMILIVILITSICVIACYCCWTEIGMKRRRKCKKSSSTIQDEDIESETNNDQYYKNIMGGRNIKSISQYTPVRNNKYHDDKEKDEDKDKTSEADNYYNQIMKNKKVTSISEYRKN